MAAELVSWFLVLFLFVSFAVAELRNLYHASFFLLIQGMLVAFTAYAHPEDLILKIVVSVLIFYMLVTYLRRLDVRTEVETMPSVTSVVVTGIFLGVTLTVLLPFIRFEGATLLAVFMLGIYVALLKRDVFKVILGVLLSANALYPALAFLEMPFSMYLAFDVTEILVALVMLWVALLIKERYGTLDGWKASLLRW